jgi:hypothetical protein
MMVYLTMHFIGTALQMKGDGILGQVNEAVSTTVNDADINE